MDHDEFEQLKTINGVEISEDETMEIQVAFDGEYVTFRHEDGTIQTMSTLCYLHFVLSNCIATMTDDDGLMLNENGITPGHVISHVIDHLHDQLHELNSSLSMSDRISKFADMMGGITSDDEEMVVMKMSENGIEEIPLSELPNELAKMKAAENKEVPSDPDLDSDPDSDEDEIIVHGTRNDPKRHH